MNLTEYTPYDIESTVAIIQQNLFSRSESIWYDASDCKHRDTLVYILCRRICAIMVEHKDTVDIRHYMQVLLLWETLFDRCRYEFVFLLLGYPAIFEGWSKCSDLTTTKRQKWWCCNIKAVMNQTEYAYYPDACLASDLCSYKKWLNRK